MNTRMIIRLLVVLLLVITLPLTTSAQSDNEADDSPFAEVDNHIWERVSVYDGFVTFAAPPGWTVESDDETFKVTFTHPEDLGQIELSPAIVDVIYTPAEMLADIQDGVPAENLLTADLVALPGGTAVRAVQQRQNGSHIILLEQIAWPVAQTLILFQVAYIPDELSEAQQEQVQAQFDMMMATVSFDLETAGAWPTVTNPAETVSLKIPPGWVEDADSGLDSLTLRAPDDEAIAIVTGVPLELPLEVSAFEGTALAYYEEQGAQIVSNALINRPPGDVIFTEAQVRIGGADEVGVDWGEYQVYLIQGQTLIVMTFSAPLDRFAEYEAIFRRMTDTAHAAELRNPPPG